LALAILSIYIWELLSSSANLPSIGLTIGLIPATAAGLLFALSVIFFFVQSKKTLAASVITIYSISLLATGLAIADTSQASSPFIAIWAGLAIFAALFGVWGVLANIIGIGVLSAALYIDSSLDIYSLITLALAGFLPLIFSLLIWTGKHSQTQESGKKTEYNNITTELSEVTDKAEAVINAIGDGVIAIDSQGIIHLINPAAQHLTGWDKQDAINLNYKSILQLVDQKDKPLQTATDPIQQALNTNQEVRNNDLNLMSKNGKKMMVSLVASPVGQSGQGIILVFRDITKEKAEEREQAEFISTASHEMRTPVASIEGYLGLAINPQTANIDDRARDFIGKAQDAAKHLGRLFQDLLDISRADDKRLSNNPRVVDVIPFVGDLVQGMQQKATEKGLRLIYKPVPSQNSGEKRIAPVYYVNLDNDHLREAVNNLIENAIKYTLKGDVVIDVTGENERVKIAIQDTGIGIPSEDMPHLFQKFYRVDNKDTRDIGGTGLGLYLSRKLVETLGGRIWANSVYGQGSTFYIELPRISGQEAEQAKNQTMAIPTPQAASAPATNQSQMPPTVAPPPTDNPAQQKPVINQPVVEQNSASAQQYKVPRGQALSKEQIAAYAAKQHSLAETQSVKPAPRTTAPAPRPAPSIPPRRQNLVQ